MPRRRRTRRSTAAPIPGMPSVGVVVLTAIVLGGAIATFPVAGISAELLNKHLWLDAQPVASSPLWGMIVRGLAGLAPGAAVLVLNAFSFLCGIGSVVLLYILSARLLQRLSPDRDTHVYVFCGVTTALYLAVSIPFGIICTRAHFLSLDLLLLLTTFFLQSEYQRTGRIHVLYAFAFLSGVVVVEYPAFAILAWPLGLLALLLMRRRGHLRRSRRTRHLLTAVACAVAGALLVLVPACWLMTGSPARVWMEDPGMGPMLRRFLAAALHQSVTSVPKLGWLLLGMVSVVPWIACLVETRRRSSLRRLPTLLLYCVLSALPLLILFDGPIAPTAVFGIGNPTLMPYLFAASTFGLLVNFWRAAIWRLWERKCWAKIWVRNGLIAVLPATLVLAPVKNREKISPEPARVFHDCALEVLDALGERQWLVTDGTLDNLLRLAALEQGRELQLIDLTRGQDDRYRRILAARFADPRRQSLARLGLLPLLREWLVTDPKVSESLAFSNAGNIWFSAGLQPVPERLVYLGRRPESTGADEGDPLDRHIAFWERALPALHHTESLGEAAGGLLARHLRWQISRVANDLGVMLQRSGDDSGARVAYRAARMANDMNAAALINLGDGDASTLDASTRAKLLELPLPDLVARHGHIHELSRLEALRQGESRPEDPPPVSESVPKRLLDVSEAFREGNTARCLEALNTMVREDPDHLPAWYLRGLIAAIEGDADVWNECWSFMAKRQHRWPAFLVIRAEQLLENGHTAGALKVYEEAFRLSPMDLRIVRPVAMAEFTQGSYRRAEVYVTQLLSLDPADPWGNFALGSIQFDRDEHVLAESSFRVALEKLRIPEAHNNLAWILTLNGNLDEARQQVDAALRLDDTFVQGWDTLGVIHMKQENLKEAEIALDRALTLLPDLWDARVHKAQLALAADRTDDALEAARELEAETSGKSQATLAEYIALRDALKMPPLGPER